MGIFKKNFFLDARTLKNTCWLLVDDDAGEGVAATSRHQEVIARSDSFRAAQRSTWRGALQKVSLRVSMRSLDARG